MSSSTLSTRSPMMPMLFVIDTTPTEFDATASSLSCLKEAVEKVLQDPVTLGHIRSLKVVGVWKVQDHDQVDVHTVDSPVQDQIGNESAEAGADSMPGSPNAPLRPWEAPTETDWSAGIVTIKDLLRELPDLESLEYVCPASVWEFQPSNGNHRWTTRLPFSKKLWAAIPVGIRHLTIDISVSPPTDGEVLKRQAFLQQSHLKPLVELRHLETLCITGMMESYQPVIWEAVFRNQNLHTLAMHMVHEPLCRTLNDGEAWPKIERHLIKTKADEDMETEYRGIDGTGHLHHKYGHGEYLDVVAIRQARIAVGLVDSIAGLVLPLRTLRLEGFVVDALPFNQGCFNYLERIEFKANCFDAGFALPAQLRDKVEVSTIKKDEEDSDSISVQTIGRHDVQLITETLGELKLRSKSVPNLVNMAAMKQQANSPNDAGGTNYEDQATCQPKKSLAKRPRAHEGRSSSYTG